MLLERLSGIELNQKGDELISLKKLRRLTDRVGSADPASPRKGTWEVQSPLF